MEFKFEIDTIELNPIDEQFREAYLRSGENGFSKIFPPEPAPEIDFKTFREIIMKNRKSKKKKCQN
jgi:hypothetical protein